MLGIILDVHPQTLNMMCVLEAKKCQFPTSKHGNTKKPSSPNFLLLKWKKKQNCPSLLHVDKQSQRRGRLNFKHLWK